MTKYDNISAPQVHLYPTTLLKFTQFAWESTRTCKNSQDFSNYEPNVTLLGSLSQMKKGCFRMKAPKLRLPLPRTTPPQATRRRKLSRPSPHRASPPCTCLSRPPAWSSTARTSCATASSSFHSPPTWSSPLALSRTSMSRRWTLTRRDTTLEVNSTRWVLPLSPWTLTNC